MKKNMDMEQRWNDTDSTQRKTRPSATLSTLVPTWNGLVLNSVLRGERLATKYVSHGTPHNTGTVPT
jgi:hypothetical protein